MFFFSWLDLLYIIIIQLCGIYLTLGDRNQREFRLWRIALHRLDFYLTDDLSRQLELNTGLRIGNLLTTRLNRKAVADTDSLARAARNDHAILIGRQNISPPRRIRTFIDDILDQLGDSGRDSLVAQGRVESCLASDTQCFLSLKLCLSFRLIGIDDQPCFHVNQAYADRRFDDLRFCTREDSLIAYVFTTKLGD